MLNTVNLFQKTYSVENQYGYNKKREINQPSQKIVRKPS